MSTEWRELSPAEQTTFWTTEAFIKGRLSDAETVEWALNLGPARRPERIAVAYVLHSDGLTSLSEPWTTVWCLIEESWLNEPVDEHGSVSFEIKQRLAAGERSGVLAKMISELVAPRVCVEPPSALYERTQGPPQEAGDLVRATLTSRRLIHPDDIGLGEIDNVEFLTAVANALEANLRYGIDAGRRIGWDGSRKRLWILGFLHHVEFPVKNKSGADSDTFHRGIAPSVKLLFAVVEQIAAVEPSAALPFVKIWSLFRTPIDARLWAAAASNAPVVSGEEVERILLSLDDGEFWDLHTYPEIATLRARRFPELSGNAQKKIALRLQYLPPSEFWPQVKDDVQLEEYRIYWAVRELRRIEVYGSALPSRIQRWLSGNLGRFDDLTDMNRNEGFLAEPIAGARVASSPSDPVYDDIKGAERLSALELAWTDTSDWRDDPAQSWLNQPQRASAILTDLQHAENAGTEFPHVWRRLCRVHKPYEDAKRNAQESKAVLALLLALPDEALRIAIEGITDWMRTWREVTVPGNDWAPAWLRVWPFAVESTNSHYTPEDIGNLSVLVQSSGEDDLDAYNTPVADLMGVFIFALSKATSDRAAKFDPGTELRQVRDAIEEFEGQALLIAQHRLVEWLPYFLNADAEWAASFLIVPLQSGKPESLPLWRAVSRRRIGIRALEIIGSDVAAQVTNPGLGTATRTNLIFSLVAESLNALYAQRPPAIPDADLQQVLRSADVDVRVRAAETVVEFVRDQGEVSGHSPEGAFDTAASPFLGRIWPQERMLVTPGISRAFAELPARSGEAFARAVQSVNRYLVAFDCYSIMDFGLYRDDVEWTPKLTTIDDEAKAEALLELLNLTVGISESAIAPYELSDALGQIRSANAKLAESPPFRRLAAIARR